MPDGQRGDARPAGSEEGRPIACALGAGDLAERMGRWERVYARAGLGRAELERGVRLEFRETSGLEDELAALVALERECCGWASWQLRREGGRLVMDASARGDGIATLQAMFVADEPAERGGP